MSFIKLLRSFTTVSRQKENVRLVKNVPVISLKHAKNISESVLDVRGTDLITFLRREQRENFNKDGRWSLFAKDSADKVTVGSILKVTYCQSVSEKSRPASFTGVLIANRRHPSEPTISLRTVIDNIGVEQLFPIFSPLIEKIEVIKRALKLKSHKAYWLREHPEKAAEFISNKKTRK